MDNMSALSGTDALSVMNATRGYGYNDGFGMNNGWFWIILLLFFGRGFYGNDNGVQDNFISNEFIKRDIFNTNQNVSSTACQTQRDVLEGKYDTQIAINNASAKAQECCCETNRNIDSVRYDTLLNFKDLQAQLASCCCDLKTAVHAEAETTRGLIQANTIQDLRDRLAASQRETDTANLALQNNAQTQTLLAQINKVPQPAYLTCSPYVPSTYAFNNCGCGCVTPTVV